MRSIIKILAFTALLSTVLANPLHRAGLAKKFDEVMTHARSTCRDFDKRKYFEYAQSMPGWVVRKKSDSQFDQVLINCISEYMCKSSTHMKDINSMATLFKKGDLACSNLGSDLMLESETPLESNALAGDSNSDVTINEESLPTNTSMTFQISTRDMACFFVGLISGVAAITYKFSSNSSTSSSSKSLRRPEL